MVLTQHGYLQQSLRNHYDVRTAEFIIITISLNFIEKNDSEQIIFFIEETHAYCKKSVNKIKI